MYNNLTLPSPTKTVTITEEEYFKLLNPSYKRRTLRKPIEAIPGETWKQYGDSWYWASDHGRVKKRMVNYYGEDVEFLINANDRNTVQLAFEDKTIQNIQVGRLIKMVFDSAYGFDELRVIHLDCNKKNHKLENLAWKTHSEAKAYYHENCDCKRPRLKSQNWINKKGEAKIRRVLLSEGDIIKLKELLNKGISQSALAEKFNVDPSYISQVKTGKIRKNG